MLCKGCQKGCEEEKKVECEWKLQIEGIWEEVVEDV